MTARPTAVVLRALGLGDFVAGLPALAMLRRRLADHRLVALMPARFEPVLRRSGLIDDLVDTRGLGVLLGAPHRPRVAVDLHGNGPASREPLLQLNPERLIAFNHDGVEWDAAEHEYHRWCRLVRAALEFEASDPSLDGLVPPYSSPMPDSVTVLHPGAAFAARRWPAARFAAVGRALVGQGHQVVVTGSVEERDLVTGVATDIPGATGLTRLGIVELFGLVAHARLVVSNDTGVAHVASLYATPSVVLCGPVAPSRWGPPARPWHHALHPARAGEAPGDPHGDELDPVLARISVNDVLGSAERVLDAVGAGAR